MRICPNCGHEIVNDAAKFCRICGEPLPPLSSVKEEKTEEPAGTSTADNSLPEGSQQEAGPAVEVYTTVSYNDAKEVSQPEVPQIKEVEPRTTSTSEQVMSEPLQDETEAANSQPTPPLQNSENTSKEYGAQPPSENKGVNMLDFFICIITVAVVFFFLGNLSKRTGESNTNNRSVYCDSLPIADSIVDSSVVADAVICPICDGIYPETELTNHINTHHRGIDKVSSPEPVGTPGGGAAEDAANNNQTNSNSGHFECPKCGANRWFNTKEDLENHMRFKHKKTMAKSKSKQGVDTEM